MCLAIPMRIESIDGDMAVAEASGARIRCSLAFVESPRVGDYILVHAGFAIRILSEPEAEETADILNRAAAASR